MELTEKEIEWVTKALDKDITRFQARKLLIDKKYPEDKIDDMLIEYDNQAWQRKLKDEPEVPKPIVEDTELKNSYQKYIDGHKDEMTNKEKRIVKKFLKRMNKYGKVLKVNMIGMKKEIENLKKAYAKDLPQLNKELGYLKEDMIPKILDNLELVEFTDPKTGEEPTKESLEKCDLEKELIPLMDEIIDTIPMTIDNK